MGLFTVHARLVHGTCRACLSERDCEKNGTEMQEGMNNSVSKMVIFYGKMKSLFYIWCVVWQKTEVGLCCTGGTLTKHIIKTIIKEQKI